MSEIQKGRPTIYGEVQSPRRRTGRPGVPAYGAESQRRYAGRMTEHYDNAQMEGAGRSALGNRARTEQAPRRRANAPAPEAYTAPIDRPARGWENMPEQELRRTDFASLAQYDKRKLAHIAYCVHGSAYPDLCADARCIEQLLKL